MEFGKLIKSFTSNKGRDVVIRYIRQEDTDELLKYVNALIQEDTYVLISGDPVTREEEAKYVQNLIELINKGEAISLLVEIKGKIAGVAGVNRNKYRERHIGIPGISLAPEYRDEGIGNIVFKTLIEESKLMGLRLLILHCFENNSRALHLYESLGFKKIGTIPEAVLFKGKYIGEINMYLPLV